MASNNNRSSNKNSKDQSQWIFMLPNSCIEDGSSNPTLVKLRHPKSDTGAMFLFSADNSSVHEVIQHKEEFRSWLIGNTVQHDGSMYMVTPVDPVFLILPYLIKANQKEGKFMQLEQIVHDEEFEESRRLCECHGNHCLELVADRKGEDDYKVYRYNEELTLQWLQAKVDRLSVALESKNINMSGGAQVDSFVQSKKQTLNKDEVTLYAFGLVSDYLPLELAKKLKDHLGVKEPVIEHEKPKMEEPKAKKAKAGKVGAPLEDYSNQNNNKEKKEEKLSRAQKQLSAVDKSGMKSISSFFKMKTK